MAVSVKTSLTINIIIVCCVMFGNFQQVSCDCSLRNDSECEVTAGIATCHVTPHCTIGTAGIATCYVIPKHLPECVTRLKVFLDSWQPGFLVELSPISLPNLTAMAISIKDREAYEQVKVNYWLTPGFFHPVPALEELQLGSQAFISFSPDAFMGATALRVLDFTRTKYFYLGLFLDIIENLQTASVQKLLLKNVQSEPGGILDLYMPDVDISAIVCPLSRSLRVLDLSHNDIQAVSFKKELDWDCAYWLDTLDLSYNRIIDNDDSIRAYSVLLFGVQYLHVGHQWDENGTYESLWQNKEYPVTVPHGVPPLWLFSDFTFLSDYWCCPSKECNLVIVLDHSMSMGASGVNDLRHLYDCSSVSNEQNCSSDQVTCDFNLTLPVIWIEMPLQAPAVSDGANNTYCCSKTSNLTIWNYSYSKDRLSLLQQNYEAGMAGIRGFHNVRKLDLSDMNPLLVNVNPLLFSDMPALEELNIAGNWLVPLPHKYETANWWYDWYLLSADYLSYKPNLTLLNVSNTYLGGIEPGAFAESPALRTLDVSGNWLTSDTFFFHVAGTNLSRIIASGNNIAYVSPAMRAELDKLGKLELDLSGNPLLCDCSTLEFVRWVRRGKIIRLINSYHICRGTSYDNFLDIFELDIDQLERECETHMSCDYSIGFDCNVTAGIATCDRIPYSLPECVTWLNLVFDFDVPNWISTDALGERTFEEGLHNVTALTISLKHHEHDIFGVLSYLLLDRLPALEIFQLRSEAFFSFSSFTFEDAKALRVLDFTRTKYFYLDEFLEIIENSQAASVQQLILKNIQREPREISDPYMPEVDISAIVCPLSRSLRVLDLSHNDIQAVSFKKKLDWGCVYWLDTLDLSYNRINEYGDSIRALSVLLFGVHYIHVDHQWSEDGKNETLWQDNEYPATVPPHGVPPLVPLSDILYSPVTWGDCPSMQLNLVLSTLPNGNDVNDLFQLYECSSVSVNISEVVCFSDEIPCDFNFSLPVTSLEIPIRKSDGPFYRSEYCCSKTSNLTIWNISYSKDRGSLRQRNFKAGILGFHNVRKLDLSYVDIAMNPLLFSDMPALEELNIAGNPQSPLNYSFETAFPLPADYLSNKPNLTLFNASNARLNGIERGAFAESPALRTLDVSRNRFTSDTFFFPVTGTKLSRIIASDNNISVVSPAMRAELDKLGKLELDLSGNPLLCDCSTLAFLRWVRGGENISLIHSSRICINTDFYTDIFVLDIDQLERDCEPWRATTFVVAITLLSVAAFLLLICGIYKRWFIRHFLFTMQEKFHAWRNPETTDIAYQFDAFVLYSSELSDRRWVHEQLVKTMENTYGFKLCIHLRNFIGGQDILDSVEMAIRKSRKVIAVMTPNFARSSWCVDEIQMTRSFENQENRRKLIVILLEDFPSVAANIPPAIQCILQSLTYLEWPTQPRRRALFWRRLQKALYSKQMTTREAQNEGFEMI